MRFPIVHIVPSYWLDVFCPPAVLDEVGVASEYTLPCDHDREQRRDLLEGNFLLF
jgi:hypothetical protein